MILSITSNVVAWSEPLINIIIHPTAISQSEWAWEKLWLSQSLPHASYGVDMLLLVLVLYRDCSTTQIMFLLHCTV